MGVDIANLAIANGGQCQLHRALGPFARRRNHVVTVRCGAVTGDFGIDFRATGQRVFQFFQNDNAAAAGNDEPVSGGVKGAGCCFGGVVIFAGHGTHRVEQTGQGPVQFLAAAGENDILFAKLDLFNPVADAVQGCGAGRCDGIVYTLDFKGGCKAGRVGRGHTAGDHEWSHAFGRAFFFHDLVGVEKVGCGRSAGPHDKAGARVGNIAFL